MTPSPPAPLAPFPPARFVELPGLSLAVHADGPADGVPVVLVHGFPELAFSWRHQVPALAAAGWRVLAPDMRGYGLTGGPAAIEAYDLVHLTGDLVGLLDAEGIDRAVFVGHDWGGIVVWAMPLLHPDRVLGVIGVNTPHQAPPAEDPIAALRRDQGPEHYVVRFQPPGEAEALFDADVGRTLRLFLRRGGVDRRAWEARPPEKRVPALLRSLQRDEALWPGEVLVDPEAFAVYERAFRATGFGRPINWYRNITRNWQLTRALDPRLVLPCLMVTAEDDLVLRPEHAEPMRQLCSDLEIHLIRACGHWTQQEKPEELNRIMIDWLDRRFGSGA